MTYPYRTKQEKSRLINEMIQIRKEQGISQAELAKLVPCSERMMARIESGEKSPSLWIFIWILDILGYQMQIVKKESDGE